MDEVKKSTMVDGMIEVYMLIFEAERWEKANGPIRLTDLERATVQGKADDIFRAIGKTLERKASIGDFIDALERVSDLRHGR
jgi:hypothetical protein